MKRRRLYEKVFIEFRKEKGMCTRALVRKTSLGHAQRSTWMLALSGHVGSDIKKQKDVGLAGAHGVL
jgi:hypothetical protein